ncbi:MAG: c-type cytochrome [Gallionella sp.]|nr:c-type cytochrome [Gallionella sp.]
MRIQNILLASLFVSLYGCQPEAPAPKAAAPAAVESSAVPPSPAAQAAAQPTVNEASLSTPVQKIEPVSPEKTTQPPANKKITAAVKEKTPQTAAEKPAPAQEVAAPVMKVEPEAKPGPVVSEADAMQLAKKNNCLACHATDKKVIGPSFKDVAAKYRGDAGAEARLTDKIAKGGSGAWGAMAMPPSPQVSEADRKTLARFVLSLK